jgi:predicted CoA-binding protein
MTEQQMGELIQEFVNQRVWAVVGASADRAKYGNRILRDLRRANYTVYAVNPKGGGIEGQPAFSTLAELPESPQVVDVVVPPSVTEEIVRQCAELGLARVWMQPGAESQAAIDYCHEHDIKVVHHVCAMVHKREW